ncbi:MAG: hypothetical protein ABEH81_04080 [Halopenitus sp.]
MTEDLCEYPTGDETPCQNPAGENGRCWIPKHNDEDADNPHGRPSLLEDNWDDIMTGAQKGMTLEGCARLAGVDESTLHRWKNEHEDFCKSLKRARAHGELKHLQSVNESGSQFLLERSFGYVKTEKREVDVDADVDTTHDVTADFVTYGTEEDDGDE